MLRKRLYVLGVVMACWLGSMQYDIWTHMNRDKPPRKVGVFEVDELGIKLLSMDLEVARDQESGLHTDRFQRNSSRHLVRTKLPLYDYHGYLDLHKTPGYNAKAFLVYNSKLALLKVSKSASTTVYGHLTFYGNRIGDPFRLEFVDVGADYEGFRKRFVNHTFITTMRDPCLRVSSGFGTAVNRDRSPGEDYASAVSKLRAGQIKHYHHLLPQSWFYYGVGVPLYVFETDAGMTARLNRFLDAFFERKVTLAATVKNANEGNRFDSNFCEYLKDAKLYHNYHADEHLYAELRTLSLLD